MDPQQELFTELLKKLRERGYRVYDGLLPPEGTPYPFIYLAETEENSQATKSGLRGEISFTINVYHDNVRNRGTVSAILLEIKKICRGLTTDNFTWIAGSLNQRILPDETTITPLLHGILTVYMKFI